MSKDLNFKRKFFILKDEYSNMRNVKAKGHGKVELRNNRLNVSIVIENAEVESYYDIILLGDNKVHQLGYIYTDKIHNGRVDMDLNYREIESAGFPLEKINGILISREEEILLGGYLLKDDKSIEKYLLRQKEDLEVIEEDTTETEEDTTETEEDIDTMEDIIEDYTIEEDILVEDMAEAIIVETPITSECEFAEDEEIMEEEETVLVEDPIVEADLDNEEQFIVNDLLFQEDTPTVTSITEEEYHKALEEIFDEPEEHFIINEEYNMNTDERRRINQKEQTTNYVLNILRYFPFIEPFKIDLMGYNWWRVDISDSKEDNGFLPYFSYIANGDHKYPLVQNAVTATNLMRKYGHYLFGLYNVNNEVKFYVYGVPGDFRTEDHPQNGTTGFNTWFEGRENIGYWIIYIDPLTGRIMYPINPMIPMD